jgi:hypothetical protein
MTTQSEEVEIAMRLEATLGGVDTMVVLSQEKSKLANLKI